jgi:hypothetical protein
MSKAKWVGVLGAALLVAGVAGFAVAEPSWSTWLPLVGRNCITSGTGGATARPTPTTSPTPTQGPTATITCTAHSASLILTSTDATVQTGQTFTVTARLDNLGCGMIGLPLYRLQWEESALGQIEELSPTEVLHYRGIVYREHDEALFTLRALLPGQVTLSCTVSFEAHLGYPGPAYWSGAGSGALLVDILP